MRPLEKKKVGEVIETFTILAEYKPYQDAKTILVANLGEYCSYCEKPIGEEELEVEHIEPKSLIPEKVRVNPNLITNEKEYQKAKALVDLVGLDKRPGHPKYLNKDKRWNKRREVWILATSYLAEFENGHIKAEVIVDLALSRGFFSVWFTIFQNHKSVKAALIQAFSGTAKCFDHNFNPIPRTQNDL